MLSALRIENFAIVKSLELEFSSGMSAFTGETGAGKSIMIDALMLAMGGRAEASAIRPGEDKCDITASFQVDAASEPAFWLNNHDISVEDGVLYLRRVLYAEGRSKSYINGQPFPLNKVRELSELLVHIHGQHQHQTLLQHVTHRQQLDQYAGHDLLLNSVSRLYKEHQALKNELIHLQSQNNQQDRTALLQFQIDELKALELQPGEMAELSREHKLLHHAREYLSRSDLIEQHLNSGEEQTICGQLNQVLQNFTELPSDHPGLKNALELINSAFIQCEEAAAEIRHFAEQIPLDPERLAAVESRMAELHNAGRKYHMDSDNLLQHYEFLQMELFTLQNNEQNIVKLRSRCEDLTKEYETEALKLRQSRQQAAARLSADITAIICQLGMPKGIISLEIQPLDKMHSHGIDRVEYKVQTNPGSPPDALNKIASGGELSRISLAIQMITAQRGATPTLLFDEVDVGIGGSTAALVGRHLRKLGERLQVFCVTHQPQVASSAHHHFLVEKHSGQSETFSSITELNQENKVNEIARMLGGLTITDQTRSHARELLDLCAI